MTCPDEAELGQYLNQELALDRAGVVDRHISGCSRCQDFLDLLVRRGSPRELLREIGPDLKGDNAEAAGTPSVPGFELTELIGTGGMGRVWKARQLDLGGRVVAIKMLFGGAHAAPEWVARFKTEAEALAKMDHPNIVKLYTSGPTPHGFFYAMEYLPAGSLADARRQNPDGWTARRAAELIAAAARAIDHAHQHGLIHRDLKPANILIAGDGAPKVADFGLARSFEGAGEYSRTGRVLGTPVYMAPEQAAGTKQLSPATDVYGLGGVMYYLLTGLPPIPDDGSELDVLTRVRYNDPVTPRHVRPTLPKDMETICLKCLRKDAGQRYETAEALAEDLDRFLTGRPILARPVSWPARAAKWVQRNPVPTIAVLLLAFAAGALGMAWQSEARAGRSDREASDATIRRLEAEQNEVIERGNRLKAERGRVRDERRDAVASALRGGDPKKALALLVAAEADGVEITPEMRFLEVDALEATTQVGKARERLETIGAEFPPAYASRRNLRLGDLLIGIEDDRARALIENAAADPTLSPADKAYARGVLAATTAEARTAFQAALATDTNHLPARRALSLVLLCSGQFPDAIRTAKDGQLLYPQHPDFLWVLFLGHGLGGNEPAAQRALTRLKPMVREDLHADLDEVVHALPHLTREFQAGVYGEPRPPVNMAHFARLAIGNPKLNALFGLPPDGPFAEGDVLLRLPPAAGNSLQEFWNMMKRITNGAVPYVEIGRDEAATARFKAMVETNPDGFMRFIYGMVLFSRATSHWQRTPEDLDGLRPLLAEAGAAFEVASTSHGLIDARLIALEKAINCYCLAGKPRGAKTPRPEWVRKGDELLRQRLRMPDPIHPTLFEIFVKTATNADDFTTARAVLDDWKVRFPKDIRATRLRADVEFMAEAYSPALRAADKVLAQNPNDAEMIAIAEQCRAKLRPDQPELAPHPRLRK